MPPSNVDEPQRPFPVYGQNSPTQIIHTDGTNQRKNGGATQISTNHGFFYLIVLTAIQMKYQF